MSTDAGERFLTEPHADAPGGFRLRYGAVRGMGASWRSEVIVNRSADGGPSFTSAQREVLQARLEMRVIDVDDDGSFHVLMRHLPQAHRVNEAESILPQATLVYLRHDDLGRIIESTDAGASPMMRLPAAALTVGSTWRETERLIPPRRLALVDQNREFRVASVEGDLVTITFQTEPLRYQSDAPGEAAHVSMSGHGHLVFDRSWGGVAEQHVENLLTVSEGGTLYEIATTHHLEVLPD